MPNFIQVSLLKKEARTRDNQLEGWALPTELLSHWQGANIQTNSLQDKFFLKKSNP
jgi:hypothetical protein